MTTLNCFALWLYEFKFRMVSGYSTLVQFQKQNTKFGVVHSNSNYILSTALPSPKLKLTSS